MQEESSDVAGKRNLYVQAMAMFLKGNPNMTVDSLRKLAEEYDGASGATDHVADQVTVERLTLLKAGDYEEWSGLLRFAEGSTYYQRLLDLSPAIVTKT